MTDTTATARPEIAPTPIVTARGFAWVALALALMTAAIHDERLWVLNFVHVLAGVLWTGIDLFMGFVMGPVLRRLDLDARRAVVSRLMPRMLLLMPTLAIVTTTAGWYLAERRGYLDLPYPDLWWPLAALAIVAVLTVQGLGILLPINLRVLFQLRKAEPDLARIGRWMRIYLWVIASQATLQITIIVIMARFVTGI